MNILLDTCSFIWAISDPDQLTPKARDLLTRPDSSIWFSPITCAEIACLSERGRILLTTHWKTWFNHYSTLNGWQAADITLAIIQDAFALPGAFHADPADRIIVATARELKMHILTADSKILSYPFVETVW